jgi:hypothetical protein
LRLAGGVVGEVDFGEAEAERGWIVDDGSGGMKNDLPLALTVEETEGRVGKSEADGEDEGEGLEDPAGIDELLRAVKRLVGTRMCGACVRVRFA